MALLDPRGRPAGAARRQPAGDLCAFLGGAVRNLAEAPGPGREWRTSRTFRFGVFELDPRAGELRKQGMKIKLQGQPVQILVMLLERPGEVVTREELQKKLWASDTFVDFEQGLNNAMKRLRAALDDDAESPHFIETLPRHGYRFIGSVNGSVQALTAEAGSPALQISRWLRFPWSALAASVLLAAIVLWSVSRTGPLPPKIVKQKQITSNSVGNAVTS